MKKYLQFFWKQFVKTYGYLIWINQYRGTNMILVNPKYEYSPNKS
jgi:hypothetical protein